MTRYHYEYKSVPTKNKRWKNTHAREQREKFESSDVYQSFWSWKIIRSLLILRLNDGEMNSEKNAIREACSQHLKAFFFFLFFSFDACMCVGNE